MSKYLTHIPTCTHAYSPALRRFRLPFFVLITFLSCLCQGFVIFCSNSAFTCKSQRPEVSSVYNNCHITEVPFWLQAAPLVLQWARFGLLTCWLRTLWFLGAPVCCSAHQHTIYVPSTHPLQSFRTCKPHFYSVGQSAALAPWNPLMFSQGSKIVPDLRLYVCLKNRVKLKQACDSELTWQNGICFKLL